jgi:N utilization substance protein B
VLKRRELRETLIKILYASQHNDRSLLSNLNDLVEASRDIDEPMPLIGEDDEQYLKKVLTDIEKNKDVIDKELKEASFKWSLDRILGIDRAIMELAIYELIYRDDIPNEVTINEAVEIAKKYSGEESYSFVNGILDTISKKYSKLYKG